MRRGSRTRVTPSSSVPPPGTVLEVYGVPPQGESRPLGGPALRPVGLAVVNPDRTISAWLDALPVGGALLLRPCPREALLAAPSPLREAACMDPREDPRVCGAR